MTFLQALDRDGTSLAYEERGTGDPTFVFVHGWTCNHTQYAAQMEHFGRRHRVIAIDLRGHGASDAPEQIYAISTFADDVAWLCAELDLVKPVLVGHSMGGLVVLEVAARFPDVPRAIVMLDAAPIVAASSAPEVALELGAALGGPDGGAARAALIEHAVSSLGADPGLQDRVRFAMATVPDHVAVSCIEAMNSWDGEGAARSCRVPALHIAADDPINDAAALRALNPCISTGQTVGAGHFNLLQVPEQVNAMIERFVAAAT
jgi:pimeloyl-ACP methyl ester carboxylesterase